MQEQNVSTVTDLKELKAMAYDQIAQKEQAEQNLKVINQRIVQVAQDTAASKTADPNASAGDGSAESETKGSDAADDSAENDDSTQA